MAKIIKRLCLPVGSYQRDGADKPTIEYRDLGVVIEYESRDGNKWEEVKLNLDILNPTLFQLARGMADKGQSTARVKLFDVQRKLTDKATPADSEAPASAEDDAGPF